MEYVSYPFAVVRDEDNYVFTFELPEDSSLANPVTMQASMIQYEVDFYDKNFAYVFDYVYRYILVNYNLCTSFVSTSALDFYMKIRDL